MMRSTVHILLPLTHAVIERLHAGQLVYLSGRCYGARDAAHVELLKTLERGDLPPISLTGQTIYYVGPAPAQLGQVIGPAGPTTSGRMDPFTPALLAQGIKGLIGKGYRSPEVKKALVAHRAVYFATVGGAAALLARHIISSRIAAYPELGPEAIFEFTFEDFPAFVINDIYGEDAYQLGRSSFIEMRQREKDAK